MSSESHAAVETLEKAPSPSIDILRRLHDPGRLESLLDHLYRVAEPFSLLSLIQPDVYAIHGADAKDLLRRYLFRDGDPERYQGLLEGTLVGETAPGNGLRAEKTMQVQLPIRAAESSIIEVCFTHRQMYTMMVDFPEGD